MTRVDFYILAEHDPLSPLTYTVRLVEKAFRLDHQIYVHTSGQQQSQQLSELLWQRPQSFLAHHLAGADSDNATHHHTIEVSHLSNPGQHCGLLINLAGKIPEFFSRFERVAEIVPGKPEFRSQTRENYLFYKERGYALNTHNL